MFSYAAYRTLLGKHPLSYVCIDCLLAGGLKDISISYNQ